MKNINMNQKIKLYSKIAACSMLLPLFAHAQVSGDYESAASGDWRVASTWLKYSGSAWNPATSYPSSTSNVTIQTGHTVTMNGSGNCVNLTIQSGAALISDGLAQETLTINGTSIVNDGVFGGVATGGAYPDSLDVKITEPGVTFTLSGSGTTMINKMRAAQGIIGTNVVIAQNATFTNMSSTDGSEVGLTGYYNGGSSDASDVDTVTINAADTAFFTNGAVIHFATVYTDNTGGDYVYNLNGVVDESASRGWTCFIPNSQNAASVLTVNINNLFKLGGGLVLVNSDGTAGTAIITVAPGVTVDASAVTHMVAGTASLIMADGTSMMKRGIAAGDSLYPISIAYNDYNGVGLSNSGTADTFTVKLKNTFDFAPADLTKVVNRQWTITESVAGGSNVTMQLYWLTGAQGSAFTPGSVSIYYVNGSGTTTEYPATVTGSGTLADPYVATATGITSFDFGEFYVGNASPSSVKGVNGAAKSIEVFPNPVDNKQIHLLMNGQPAGTYNVAVMNAIGQVVYNGSIEHTGNASSHNILLDNNIAPGFYELQVSGEKVLNNISVIIK